MSATADTFAFDQLAVAAAGGNALQGRAGRRDSRGGAGGDPRIFRAGPDARAGRVSARRRLWRRSRSTSSSGTFIRPCRPRATRPRSPSRTKPGPTLTREIEANFPTESLVGWQHTHPGFGIFLSGYDLFIHRNFFAAAVAGGPGRRSAAAGIRLLPLAERRSAGLRVCVRGGVVSSEFRVQSCCDLQS